MTASGESHRFKRGVGLAVSSLLAKPENRIFWLKTVVVAAFCIGLFMSARLWIGPRSYPTVPVFGGLPALDDIVARGLFAALFGLAAAILVAPKPQKFIALFLLIVLVFCGLDQTRWQPWVFQYCVLLAALGLFSWGSQDFDGEKRTLNIARLVIAGTYIFSGLQKLNWNFIENDFPWIVQPITDAIPSAAKALHLLGMAVPLVQVGFGVGLLTRRFRRVALVLAVSMHLFILAMFGPAGLDWNCIVWPWTAAMAVLDILLFAGSAEFSLREVIWPKARWDHAAVFALSALLPILSFFNLWDSLPSSAIYSGNLTEAIIYASDAGASALPAAIRQYVVHTSPDTNVLNIQRWAIQDVDIIPYPETRVFKAIAKSLCGQLGDPAQLALVVREQRMFFSRPETTYRCWEL
jgi:uncharacterized membrane protein YphA (DoxX/SURF4 family)